MSIVSKTAYGKHEQELNEYRIRQQAYRDLFNNPDAIIVLRDLIQFCRYTDISITDSPSLNAHLLGLKSVISHIDEMIESELMEIINEEE